MSSPAIVHTAREAWLLRRRELVTASDAAAILGLDPYRKPADVYAEKLGLRDDESDGNWPLIYGLEFQNGIGRAYARDTGRVVVMESLEVPEITIHPDLPWLGSTLDGKILGGSEKVPAPAAGEGTFEAKASSIAHTWSDDELPVPFQVQSTVQQACASTAWGAIGAFVSLRTPPRRQDIVFDRELFELMVPKLEEFHRRVQQKELPLDDPGWFSHDAIRKLWSANNGQATAFNEEADLALVKEWRDEKAKRKAAEDRAEELGDRLRLRLAGAAIAYMPDGTAVALSNVKESWVEAYMKAAHTRLLDKKGRK